MIDYKKGFVLVCFLCVLIFSTGTFALTGVGIVLGGPTGIIHPSGSPANAGRPEGQIMHTYTL